MSPPCYPSDTMAANDSGKLKEMLKEAGLSVA